MEMSKLDSSETKTKREFLHRMNKDGTTDSICPHCYITVGRSTWEADLDQAEMVHRCDPKRLRQFQPAHKPPFRVNWLPPKKLNRIA